MKEKVSWKSIALAAVILYVISPADFAPGVLMDDLALIATAVVPLLKSTGLLKPADTTVVPLLKSTGLLKPADTTKDAS